MGETTKINKMAAFLSKAALLLFIAISFFISCTKDELPISNQNTVVETRQDTIRKNIAYTPLDGQGDNVLYRGSMSVDNYLVVNKDGTKPARQHTAYNSSKIRLINFSSISTTKANIGGVICSRYVVSINFTDGSVENITAFTKDTLSSFVFVPKSSLLGTSNQCKYIKWIEFSSSSSTYNEFFNTYGKSIVWEIKCDGRRAAAKAKDPVSKSSTQFMPSHKH